MRGDAVPAALWPHLSRLIAEKTGLHFPPERRPDLQRALSQAAPELGFESTAECANWLLCASLTSPQIHTLASHLTIGETYFFRERRAFDALAQEILPGLIARRRGKNQRLRVWSAACSTGEEPYSLAILLRQLLPDWDNWRVTILATDINPRALKTAAEGVYGEWSFRDTAPQLRERYFNPADHRRFAIAPHIRQAVTFAQMNLVEDGFPSLATGTNAMDLILCRNVLFYFTPAQARKVVGNLHRSLIDDGWLLTSATECSQELFSKFAVVSYPGAIVYQKRSAPTPAVEAQPSPVESHVPTVMPYVPEAPAVAGEDDTPDPFGPQDFSLLARALANRGDLVNSLAWSERWIEADKLNAAAYYLHAMVSQELGDRAAARRSLQRAIYLEPDLALAHFALGNLSRTEERQEEARRHFDNALRLVRGLPSETAVAESDGLTAGRLTEILSTLTGTANDGIAR